MVPQWIPLGGNAWTGLTGIALVLAGLAIVSGILDVFGCAAARRDVVGLQRAGIAAEVGGGWIRIRDTQGRRRHRT
jgi:uncharacterized membrane protein YdcZ (DUF606 family)